MKKSILEYKIKLLEQDIDCYKKRYKDLDRDYYKLVEDAEHYDMIIESYNKKEAELCSILTKSLFGELEVKDFVWMATNYPNTITIPKHIQCNIIDYGVLELTKADTNEDE